MIEDFLKEHGVDAQNLVNDNGLTVLQLIENFRKKVVPDLVAKEIKELQENTNKRFPVVK